MSYGYKWEILVIQDGREHIFYEWAETSKVALEEFYLSWTDKEIEGFTDVQIRRV